jgi:hypothetical protein
MSDDLDAIRKAGEVPPLPEQAWPAGPPELVAIARESEAPGWLQLTVAAGWPRADGRMGAAHLDCLIPVGHATDAARQLVKAAQALVELAKRGRPS